jgi:hypothetical protein
MSFFSNEKLVAHPHLDSTFGEIKRYFAFPPCHSRVEVFGTIFPHSSFFSSSGEKKIFFQEISIDLSQVTSKSSVRSSFVPSHPDE